MTDKLAWILTITVLILAVNSFIDGCAISRLRQKMKPLEGSPMELREQVQYLQNAIHEIGQAVVVLGKRGR